MKTIYVGFMRMITFNYKLFCKPVEMGWRGEMKHLDNMVIGGWIGIGIAFFITGVSENIGFLKFLGLLSFIVSAFGFLWNYVVWKKESSHNPSKEKDK